MGGVQATPKNSDRPDLNSSVQLMAPAFRGSAATPTHLVSAQQEPSGYAYAPFSSQAVNVQAIPAPLTSLEEVSAPVCASPARRASHVTSLNVDVAQQPNSWCAGVGATPKNSDRPNLNASLQLMSASFRGSGSTPSGSSGMRILHAPTSPSEPSPPDIRPFTAPPVPPRQGQFQRTCPVTPLGGHGMCVSASAEVLSLPTPTNSDRKAMMSRSSRSIRSCVLESRATPQTAVFQDMRSAHVSSPPPATVPAACSSSPPKRFIAAPLGAEPLGAEVMQVAGCLQTGAFATPKNSDRCDMNASMRIGTPSFRGSAAMPLGASFRAVPDVPSPPGFLVSQRLTPAGGTPAANRCFTRT